MKADPKRRQLTQKELDEIAYENGLLKSFGISLNPMERHRDKKISDEDFRKIIAKEMVAHKDKIHCLRRIVYYHLPNYRDILDKLIPIA